MWAVVNEAGGTAPIARLPHAGRAAGGQDRLERRCAACRASCASTGFNSENLPWEFRPHALFVCFAPYDAPRYAVSVVVEHGNAGAAAAAPLARDIMIDVLTRDPANRQRAAPARRVAAGGARHDA